MFITFPCSHVLFVTSADNLLTCLDPEQAQQNIEISSGICEGFKEFDIFVHYIFISLKSRNTA